MTQATIETIKMQVEVQANGLIRNSSGYLIAKLYDDVAYESDHVKGHLLESSVPPSPETDSTAQ